MRIRILALALLVAAAGVHAQTFSSLEERMSQADFQRAGLGKLSPAELKYLDQWLQAHGAAGNAGAPIRVGPANMYGYRTPVAQARTVVESTLTGPFGGWDSHSTFNLANGQVWRTSDGSSGSCEQITDPKVTIKPMMMDSWLMYVQGCGDSLRVERVR
ncbi:MAG: hypothetical protein KGI40_12025 [Xanthomonadaceae bacterium]|nr:hypothetical protein [Xanthomonadaceae bacterium]MDE1959795.1 hypothetical protein [Xanthomonadaceae bacterium]MDE2244854.1 hypothetical protein [Xanthomonadaceae bacterium]